MFVGTGKIRKPAEHREARRLREQGVPFKQIAARVGVSVSTAHSWTRDIEVSAEQARKNLYESNGPRDPLAIARRAAAWSEGNRERRRRYQEEGRARARQGEPLHLAGCMLYWAEGSKHRNCLSLGNSDVAMLRMFGRFLRESMGVSVTDFRVRLNVHLNNGLPLRAIEDHWLAALGAPRTSLRRHSINNVPISSSGTKRNLPFGVCSLRVARSTWLIQHIYGAIQEYGGFDQPLWLDLGNR